MKRIIAATLAAVGLSGAGLVEAAGADLSVKGTLQPGACNLTLGNGGTFDAGTMTSESLYSDSWATFTMSGTVPLSVTCTTPTRFGLRLQDNRAGSVLDESPITYGLGTSNGQKIGSWHSWMDVVQSDGQSVDALHRIDSSAPWEPNSPDPAWRHGPEFLVSFTAAGDTLPAAFDHISAELMGNVTLNNTVDLDVSQQVQLDGSATLELVYL